MKTLKSMQIYFTDGTKLSLIFPKQTDDIAVMLNKLDRALNAKQLLIEHEGTLMIIPQNNIKFIEVDPSPERLPEYAILGAQLLTAGSDKVM